MISIRLAVENDIEALYAFDLSAQRENVRQEFIHHEVINDYCFVAELDEKLSVTAC